MWMIPATVCIVAALSVAPLSTAADPPAKDAKIPVRFTLDKPGYVTLVIEDAKGLRVCNLIQDTLFDAGDHIIYWDGYDVGVRRNIPKEKGHGHRLQYDVLRHRVAPGTGL